MAIAYSGFMINLFNLIPVSPLDGGRITQILSPRIWFLGAPHARRAIFLHAEPDADPHRIAGNPEPCCGLAL